MLLPIMLAAVAIATPSPSPSVASPPAVGAPIAPPSPAPATFAPSPAPSPSYHPIACGVLIHKAHLAGRAITDDSLAQLLAAANHEHHAVDKKGRINAEGVSRAIVDYYDCFVATKKGAK